MKIHSFSKVIALPLVLIFAAGLYYILEIDDTYWYLILIPMVVIVALYTMHPQIDYWYHTRNPIPLDEELIFWLNKYSPYYKNLKKVEKELYEYRLGLYLEARGFVAIGSEHKDVPEDVKCAIASEAIKIGLGHPDFLIGEMNRIYLYKSPFPSPRMQFLHTAEVFDEDGTIIMSMAHLIPGLIDPDQYYNIVMHCYAEAFMIENKHIVFPIIDKETWPELESINGFSKNDIETTLGYAIEDMRIIHINYFFTYPKEYKMVFPDFYNHFVNAFKQDPLNGLL
jgi:Mlc titration factor MtfA (ptsG expression regulator)